MVESLDLTQVAKGGNIAQRWTKHKKTDFAPGPGTAIVGFSVKGCAESTQNQLQRPVLRPIRGTFLFLVHHFVWFAPFCCSVLLGWLFVSRSNHSIHLVFARTCIVLVTIGWASSVPPKGDVLSGTD